MSKQQRLALIVSILASFVAFLDASAVNVALPAIQRSLGGGLSTQQWVVDAYLITLGALILVAGSLSDLFGRKKVLVGGLISFGLTSLLCAVAPSSSFLIVARGLQGIAGALLVPSSLALIISVFSGNAQAKAIGTWTGWTGISFIFGPLLSGILVDAASWRLVFAINIIPILVTLELLRRLSFRDEIHEDTPVDMVGAALCVLGLGGPVFALIEQPTYGWGNPLIYLPLIIGLLLFAGFIGYERRASHPMLTLDLFKVRNFSVGNIATIAIYAGLSVATFLIVLFLQQVGGYSALASGMALLPITLIMFVLSPRFGALAGKYGPRLFMSCGPLLAGCGFLLLLRITDSASYWSQIFPAIIVFGLGLSMTVAPLTAAVLGHIDSRHAGVGSAINNAISRIAGLLAIAAIGLVVGTQFNASLEQQIRPAPSNQVERQAILTAEKTPLSVKLPSGLGAESQAFKQALYDASLSAFRKGIIAMSILLIIGGLISAVGIRNTKNPSEPS
jgi:EmrB/QacA subfamily drug resistance transporter